MMTKVNRVASFFYLAPICARLPLKNADEFFRTEYPLSSSAYMPIPKRLFLAFLAISGAASFLLCGYEFYSRPFQPHCSFRLMAP